MPWQVTSLFRRAKPAGREEPCKEPDETSIVSLPNELIAEIYSLLPNHDQFRLSQTCHLLRINSASNWRCVVSALDVTQKNEFWTGLAFTLPEHWACAKCCRLHHIRDEDTPIWQRLTCNAEQYRSGVVGAYRLQSRHVQIALKLAHNGHSIKAITPPLRYKAPVQSSRFRVDQIITAHPRIVNGRFLLLETWVYTSACESVTLCMLRKLRAGLCPHLKLPRYCESQAGIRRCSWMDGVTKFEQTVGSAVQAPGSTVYNSCPYCPTDYTIQVSKEKDSVTLSAWRDFGVYGSALDSTWIAQTSSDTGIPPYTYIPGSVREMHRNVEVAETIDEPEICLLKVPSYSHSKYRDPVFFRRLPNRVLHT